MTHTNKTIKIISSAIFAIILLYAICYSSLSIFTERKQNYSQGAESSEIAYSSALLGGFKGVIADILWLRLTDLQSEHKLLELLELSELVTQLEPHIAEVWTFHAWNLSYNISLLATNKEDKWNWIKKGFELLRDKGLEINPNNPVIALELAWIFQHKIGTKGADKNGNYYRTQWVCEISPYLGPNGEIPVENSITSSELELYFKLNVQIMQEIENQFGKLDWRTPYAYSLYWGWIAKKANNKDTILRSTRMIYSSATKLALNAGKIIGNPLEENWVYSTAPDFSLLEKTCTYIYDCMYNFDSPGIKHMFAGFTWTCCNYFISQNKTKEAQALYTRLCNSFSGYDFPTLDDFIGNPAELEAFTYAIDGNFVTLIKQK